MLESGENYLETILMLTRKNGYVRSVDIVEELSYAKSSVSRAVNSLKTEGFIAVDAAGFITLTDKGKTYAEKIYERHVIITNFLEKLGVDRDTADKDACRIEHIISDKTFERIKASLKKED